MAAFIVGSMVVPVLARRVRLWSLIGAGLVVGAVGFGVLTQVDGAAGLGAIVIGSVIYSLGLSPVVILATDLIVGSAPVERAGAASAISETSSELGGALGIAVLGSIGVAVYRGMMATGIPLGVPPDAAEVARGTLGGAVSVAQQLPDPLRAELLGTARDAFAHAFQITAVISAVLARRQVHERELAEVIGRAAVVAPPEISIASQRSSEPRIGEVERDLIPQEPRPRHPAMTGLATHHHMRLGPLGYVREMLLVDGFDHGYHHPRLALWAVGGFP